MREPLTQDQIMDSVDTIILEQIKQTQSPELYPVLERIMGIDNLKESAREAFVNEVVRRAGRASRDQRRALPVEGRVCRNIGRYMRQGV